GCGLWRGADGERAITVPENPDPRQSGDGLLQQLELFGDQRLELGGGSSQVSARVCETRHEAGSDGVREGDEHDRNRRGRFSRGADRPWTGRPDDIDLRLDEPGGKSGEPMDVSFRPAVLDRNGLTRDPAQLAQTSVEPQFRGHRWGAAVSEISNARDPGALRLGVERRQGEAERETDREPDPPHDHLDGG